MAPESVLNARVMAVWRTHRRSRVIVHSDPRKEWTRCDRRQVFAQHGSQGRLSRHGNDDDNAVTAVFFFTNKVGPIKKKDLQILIQVEYALRFFSEKVQATA